MSAIGDTNPTIQGGTDGTEIGNVGDKLKTTDALSGAAVFGAITVGTSAVEAKVGGSPLAARKLLTIHNNGSQDIFWGYADTVTTSSGTPIFKNQTAIFEFTEARTVWLISGTAGQNVRIGEVA